VIRLRFGVKNGCDRRATSTVKASGERTRKAALDTAPAANRVAAVSPMGKGRRTKPAAGWEGDQSRWSALMTATVTATAATNR
jgi:hypothetical protein